MAEIGATYIINCYNTGKIISTGENSTDSYAGGIVGGEYAATINIINCYNLGDIKAKKQGGGILAGGIAGTTTISNCYNMGNVNGATSLTIGSGTIEKCYYLDGVGTTLNGVALTKNQLLNKDIVENDKYIIDLLNSYVTTYNENNDKKLSIWKSDTNTGYPTFE